MMKKTPHMEIDPHLIEEALDSVEKVEGKTPHEEPPTSPAPEAETPSSTPEGKGEYYDRLVRVTADFENFRKRSQREKLEYIKFANEDLVRSLLPIMDNFERALSHADNMADVNSIREGVSLIFNQIQSALTQFGVRSESALGKPFDPLIHEAVSQKPSPEHAPSTVIEEHQKAYHLHDRLLRPAMVTVATETKKEGEPDPGAEDSGPSPA